jgi:hypothetical protein
VSHSQRCSHCHSHVWTSKYVRAVRPSDPSMGALTKAERLRGDRVGGAAATAGTDARPCMMQGRTRPCNSCRGQQGWGLAMSVARATACSVQHDAKPNIRAERLTFYGMCMRASEKIYYTIHNVCMYVSE